MDNSPDNLKSSKTHKIEKIGHKIGQSGGFVGRFLG